MFPRYSLFTDDSQDLMPIFNLYENGCAKTTLKTPLPLCGAKWEVLWHCNNGTDMCMQLTHPLYYTGVGTIKHCFLPPSLTLLLVPINSVQRPPFHSFHVPKFIVCLAKNKHPSSHCTRVKRRQDRRIPKRQHEQSAAEWDSMMARGLQHGVDKSLIVQLRKSQ